MVPAKMLTILVSVAALFAGALLWDSDQASAEDTVTTVSAETGTTGNCDWSLENQVLTITGPVTADEEPDGSMADYGPKGAPWYGKTIKEIYLENVVYVGNYVFQDCTDLESVNTAAVKTIGKYAFFGCTALGYVEISGTVGEYAFSGCSSLRNVLIYSGSEDSIGSYAFSGCVYLNLIRFKGSSEPVLNDNSLDLSDVEPLTVIIATENPAYITPSATGTKTSVVFDAGPQIPVEITGTYVYSGSEITLPDSEFEFFDSSCMVISGNKATEVGTYTAEVGLKDGYVWSDGTRTPVTAEWIILPNAGGNVGWILNGTELTLTGSGVTADYTSTSPAPWGTGITKVTIGTGITGLGSYLFAGCTLLEAVYFESDMVSLGEGVFSVCTSLRSLDISGFTASIPDRMFEGCTSLESVYLPKTCTSIGAYAFSGCTALTKIEIPSSVNTLGQSAFSGCINLKELTAPISLDLAVSSSSPAFNECASIEKITLTAGKGFDYTMDTACYTPWQMSDSLKEFVLSDGVTSVGDFTFYEWFDLRTISIPASVTEIGESAFSLCTRLTAITIPSSVTALGQSAFAGCTGLKELTLPIGLDAAVSAAAPAFDGCTSIEKVTFTGTAGHDYSSDVSDAVPWCISTSLNEVVLSDGVTSIGKYMFNGCSVLQTITIPSSVTTVGDHAFNGCSALKTIAIPSTVVSIGDYAFNGCSGLTFAVFKGTPTLGTDSFKLSDSAFTLAVSVQDGYLDKVKDTNVVGSYATILNAVLTRPTVLSETVRPYSDGGTSTVTIDDLFSDYDSTTMSYSGVLTGSAEGGYKVSISLADGYAWSDGTWGDIETFWWILKNMFDGTSCYWYVNGTELVIAGAGKMKDFDYNSRPSASSAYSSWKNVESVVVASGVTTIGAYTFNGCSKITSASISETVTSISTAAFSQSGLKEINIPGTVKTIWDNAFTLCSSLETVILNEGLETIKGSAFNRCSALTSITLPEGAKITGGYAFEDCTSLQSADLGRSSATVLYTATFGDCTQLNSVILPSGLTEIQTDAFENTALTSIEIPDSVSSLGQNVFKGCFYLESIDLSNTTVSEIGSETFSGCAALKSVLLPETLTDIADSAFNSCSALASIDLGKTAINTINQDTFAVCTALSTVILPAKLETISERAFSGCSSLTQITIPATVTYVGSEAFYDCSLLEFVRFDGTPTTLDYNCFKTGTYYLTISASDDLYNTLSENKTEYFGDDTIELYKPLTKPTLSKPVYAYTGSEVSAEFSGFDKNTMSVSGDKETELGTYTAVIGLSGNNRYWSDGTQDSLEYEWKISRITGDCVWSLNGTELTISGSGEMGDYSASSKAPWGTEITKVTFAEGVTAIGAYAFADCVNLASVTIPSTVTKIGESAFSGCSGLKSVDFKCDSVILGDNSFKISSTGECTLVVYGSVTLSENVTGTNVSVRSAVLDRSLLSISVTYTYTGSPVTVPESDIDGFDQTKMELSGNSSSTPGKNALYIKPKAGYAWADGTFESVGLDWYINCTGDCFWAVDGTTLTITGSGKLGNYSVSSPAPWGTEITKVILSDGVTYLGRYAFAGCTKLTEVTVPAKVVGIGDDCFNGCSSLTKIVFNGTPAFGTNSLCLSTSDSLTIVVFGITDKAIPAEATGDKVSVTYAILYRSSLSVSKTYTYTGSDITVLPGDINGFDSAKMILSDNTSSSYGDNTLYVRPASGYAWSDGTYEKFGVVWHAYNSTGDCFWVKEGTAISITGSGRIGDYSASSPAPWGTEITSVTLGDGVTYIGKYAFAGCTKLTSVTIPSSVTEIGESAFSGCSGLKSVDFKCTSVTLGNSCFELSSTDECELIVYGSVTLGDAAIGSKVSVRYAILDKSALSLSKTYTYTGSDIKVPETDIGGFITGKMVLTDNTSSEPGSHTLHVGPASGYAWKDGTYGTVDLAWSIDNSTGACSWLKDGTGIRITGSGRIGDYSASSPAPWGTEITSVSLGDGVTYIGKYAFAGCT